MARHQTEALGDVAAAALKFRHFNSSSLQARLVWLFRTIKYTLFLYLEARIRLRRIGMHLYFPCARRGVYKMAVRMLIESSPKG